MPRFLLLIGIFSLQTCPAMASGLAGAEVMREHQQNLHCAQDTRGTSLGGHLDTLYFKQEGNILDDYNGQADSCTTSPRSSHHPGLGERGTKFTMNYCQVPIMEAQHPDISIRTNLHFTHLWPQRPAPSLCCVFSC
jgi:hypothetical protein